MGHPAGNPAVPQLSVHTGATAFLDGLQLSGNGSSMAPGLRIDAARVWLDRSRVVDNNGGGIQAINDAQLHLRNCFVGGDVSDANALAVDAATASILDTTVGGGFGTTSALSCNTAATVTVRNSWFVARTDDDEIQCVGATIEHSAAELDLGGTNVTLGDMQTTWFVGYGTGDFHLSPTHPASIDTAAQWQQGDPLTDIDGDSRPSTDGSPDFAGADVP